jgi:hypothetical protein
MPVIAGFYGIVIHMYYDDHNPPHFHASYGNARAWVRIADGVTIKGELPPTAARMVRDWALVNRSQLEQNWQRALNEEPLERLGGPDANQ